MRSLVEYFIRFKKSVGRKVYFLLFLMLIVGFVEGVAVTLFLPILQGGFGSDKLSRILSFVFNIFHISYSFTLVLIFILVFFVLRAFFLISYARYFGRILADMRVELRQMILTKVFTVDYLYILKKEIGYLNNVITREIPFVVNAFKDFSELLKYIIFAVMYIALSLLLSFKVAIVIIGLSPIAIILMRTINVQIRRVSGKVVLSHGKFQSLMIQCLSKLKYLKSTLSSAKISKIVQRKNINLGNLRYRQFFLQHLSKNLFEPIVVLTAVSLLFYYVVILGKGVNEVMFLVFLFMQVARQFINAQSSYRRFLAASGAIETFNRLEVELDNNRENLNTGGVTPDFDKVIAFRNVSVIFMNGKRALDNVNIRIPPRSVVAFVGHSGSGKSTIANMITGILKPTSGKMSFGDTGYNRLNLKSLRENIGYVTQEDIIFNASIMENISLWDEDTDVNKLAKVIEMAHITGFVSDLPDRQNSMLGDNGLDISGGQRQRITIAREFYKDAKLLILDEATSSLDSKAEKKIYENLKEFKGKKTMVVIAHRLSTIRNADYIYVLDGGKVVEEGTYDELYGRIGEFTKMVEDQKLV